MEYLAVHASDGFIDTIIITADSSQLANAKFVEYLYKSMGWAKEAIKNEFEEGNIRIRPLDKLVRI